VYYKFKPSDLVRENCCCAIIRIDWSSFKKRGGAEAFVWKDAFPSKEPKRRRNFKKVRWLFLQSMPFQKRQDRKKGRSCCRYCCCRTFSKLIRISFIIFISVFLFNVQNLWIQEKEIKKGDEFSLSCGMLLCLPQNFFDIPTTTPKDDQLFLLSRATDNNVQQKQQSTVPQNIEKDETTESLIQTMMKYNLTRSARHQRKFHTQKKLLRTQFSEAQLFSTKVDNNAAIPINDEYAYM
jgi:hypothetical protein